MECQAQFITDTRERAHDQWLHMMRWVPSCLTGKVHSSSESII